MTNTRRMQMATAGNLPSNAGLYTWGHGANGGLGLGDVDVHRSEPTQLGTLTDWTVQMGGSSNGGCTAIKSDGTLWTWGDNPYGQLGLGDTTDRSSPVQVGALTTWAKTSNHGATAHAIKTDGTLWGMGVNSWNGNIGDNTTTNRSSPVQVGSATNWSVIASTASDAKMAVQSNGTLWSWGWNYRGSLGRGLGLGSVSVSSPAQVGSLTNWSTGPNKLSGSLHFGAVKTDGTLWTWGDNTYGQLGLGDTTNIDSPVQVGSLTNWDTISTGGGDFFAARKTDGTIWTWGRNQYGYLGHGNTTSLSSPVQVGSLTSWAEIDAAWGVCYARKTDGTLWAWGANTQGNVGDGTTTVRSSPVQVGELTSWTSISVHGFACRAISS